MGYVIETSKRDVSGYGESGNWLDGDQREIRDYGTDSDTYDPEYEEGNGPVTWAVSEISKTDAYEPSVYPVPAELPEHAWLSGSYQHPYLSQQEETTIRLTGDWTPAERAQVFRMVYAWRVHPNG